MKSIGFLLFLFSLALILFGTDSKIIDLSNDERFHSLKGKSFCLLNDAVIMEKSCVLSCPKLQKYYLSFKHSRYEEYEDGVVSLVEKGTKVTSLETWSFGDPDSLMYGRIAIFGVVFDGIDRDQLVNISRLTEGSLWKRGFNARFDLDLVEACS